MSEKSERENAEVSGTTQRSVESSPLTIQNVQRLQKELEGLDRLYGSSQSIEGYIKNTEHHLEISHSSSKGSSEEQRNSSRNSSRSSSPECVDILGVDGTVITRMTRSTQTDWGWVLRKLNQTSKHACSQAVGSVPKHEKRAAPQQHEEHRAPTTEESIGQEVVRNNESVTGSTDSQVLLQAENLTGKFDKITALTSSSDSSLKLQASEAPNVLLCDYCQQAKKPEVTREKLREAAEPRKLFCCDMMWRMRELFLKEEEEEKTKRLFEAAKDNEEELRPLDKTESQERVKQRLREWESIRSLASNQPCGIYSRQRAKRVQKDTISYRLSDIIWNSQQESQLPEMEIITPPETLTLPDNNAGAKRKTILTRHHRNGRTFVLIFPDGTGHVFYPSGRIAVLISSVHPGHFIYVILEDAPLLPRIQAIFTSRGQATCYHPNGNVCISLTPVGGAWSSESGALKRRWSWFDLSTHVHAPPFQPVGMTLSPNVSIRICTQESIGLTFTAGKNSVRFNMGTKLKAEHVKGLILPGPDILESYLQKKTVEILCLLQRLQSSVSYRHAEAGQIASHHGLLAQARRLRERTAREEEKSSKKTKLPRIFKQTEPFGHAGKSGFLTK